LIISSFILFIRYYWVAQIKEGEMDQACGTRKYKLEGARQYGSGAAVWRSRDLEIGLVMLDLKESVSSIWQSSGKSSKRTTKRQTVELFTNTDINELKIKRWKKW
jgi:hypothetical protein